MIKFIFLAFLSLLVTSCNSSRDITLLIGSSAKNITQVTFKTGSESFNKPEVLITTDKPSFFVQKDSEHIYGVNNVERGILKAYKRNDENVYQELNWKSVRGSEPNNLALHPNHKFLAVANYHGRNLPVISFLNNEKINRIISRDIQSGSGPDPLRQKSAHITWVGWNPDGNKLYSANLGADTIGVNDFVRGTGELKEGQVALAMKAGDGPRVMSFNKKFDRAYILCELSSTIVVAKVNSAGFLDNIQRVNLPSDKKQMSVMAISPAGDYLYASNGGRNFIEVFSILAGGELKRVASIASQGQYPSAFYIDEKNEYFFVSHQGSNTVNVFKIDESGDQFLIPIKASLKIKSPAHIAKKLGEKKGRQ